MRRAQTGSHGGAECRSGDGGGGGAQLAPEAALVGRRVLGRAARHGSGEDGDGTAASERAARIRGGSGSVRTVQWRRACGEEAPPREKDNMKADAFWNQVSWWLRGAEVLLNEANAGGVRSRGPLRAVGGVLAAGWRVCDQIAHVPHLRHHETGAQGPESAPSGRDGLEHYSYGDGAAGRTSRPPLAWFVFMRATRSTSRTKRRRTSMVVRRRIRRYKSPRDSRAGRN